MFCLLHKLIPEMQLHLLYRLLASSTRHSLQRVQAFSISCYAVYEDRIWRRLITLTFKSL